MEEYIIYIENKTDELKKKVSEFESTNRKDEANLLKVQINVYDVCKTVFNVFKKTKTSETFKEEYLTKLSDMCATWDTNLDNAKAFDDIKTYTVEKLKIQAITDAQIKFKEYWGE